MELKKILIVVDDSPASGKAVQFGFNLARDLDAKVVLLTVIEPGSAIGNPDAGVFPDDTSTEIEARAYEFLERMKSSFADAVETELQVIAGEIIPTVVQIVNDYDADLVVTGTHGRTGFVKLFKGSIAESIIEQLNVPVCVVPMEK